MHALSKERRRSDLPYPGALHWQAILSNHTDPLERFRWADAHPVFLTPLHNQVGAGLEPSGEGVSVILAGELRAVQHRLKTGVLAARVWVETNERRSSSIPTQHPTSPTSKLSPLRHSSRTLAWLGAARRSPNQETR